MSTELSTEVRSGVESLARTIRETHLQTCVARIMAKVEDDENPPDLRALVDATRFLTTFSRSQQLLDRDLGIQQRGPGRPGKGDVAVIGHNVTVAQLGRLSESEQEEVVLASLSGDEERVKEILGE